MSVGAIGAGIGAAQLGLGIFNAFGGRKGPSTRAFGLFDTVKAISGTSSLTASQPSPGLFTTRLRSPNIDAAKAGFPGLISDLQGIRSEVKPGFGRFTEAALTAAANARSRAKGDIKDQIARRRLLGSSFGADTLVRSEKEFAQLENQFTSAATLQEIATTASLIGQEFQTLISQINVELEGLKVASNFSASLLAGAQASQQAFNKTLQAEARGQGQGIASLFSQAQSLISQFGHLSGGSADQGTAGALP